MDNSCLEVCFVEGNIGVGKTTLLKELERRGFDVVYEPVDEWEKAGLLKKMYDGSLSKAVFQQTAAMTRWSAIVGLLISRTCGIVFVERSPFSDRDVFAKLNVTDESEWAAYGVMHDNMLKHIISDTVQARFSTAWMTCDIATAQMRIETRDRKSETTEDTLQFAGYLADLQQAHEDMFASTTWDKLRMEVANTSPEQLADELLHFMTTLVARPLPRPAVWATAL